MENAAAPRSLISLAPPTLPQPDHSHVTMKGETDERKDKKPFVQSPTRGAETGGRP